MVVWSALTARTAAVNIYAADHRKALAVCASCDTCLKGSGPCPGDAQWGFADSLVCNQFMSANSCSTMMQVVDEEPSLVWPVNCLLVLVAAFAVRPAAVRGPAIFAFSHE